jgi:hypothetical protein
VEIAQLTTKPRVPDLNFIVVTFFSFFRAECQAAFIGVGMIVGNPDGSAAADKDFNVMSKFLNRILGIPVKLQNEIFEYFTANIKKVIDQAKRIGTWDQGILG